MHKTQANSTNSVYHRLLVPCGLCSWTRTQTKFLVLPCLIFHSSLTLCILTANSSQNNTFRNMCTYM